MQASHPSSCRRADSAYTLVELVLATLLFVIAGVGSVTLFTLTIRQVLDTQDLQEEQFAIAADQADILRLNDRYSCASGACTASTSATNPPGESEYIPNDQVGQNTFYGWCNQGSLVDPLVSQLQALALSAQMVSLGISRAVEKENSGVPSAHRYSVTWRSRDNAILRQITLSPTIAAWCP